MTQVYIVCFINNENGTTTYGTDTVRMSKINNLDDAKMLAMTLLETVCKSQNIDIKRTTLLSVSLIYEG